MRNVKRFFFYFLLVVSSVVVFALVTGNGHFITAVQKTYLSGQTGPSIDDFDKFTQRRVGSNSGANLVHAKDYISEVPKEDEEYLKSIETSAIIVVQDDSLLLEKYFDDYTATSITNSFSMAKSFVSMAIGAAIQQGLLPGIDVSASKYIPELEQKGMKDVTIRHLLQMSSGIDFDENYKNPFGYQAKVYYGGNLRENTLEFDQKLPSGTQWEYLGGNTILLSLIVERVSGKTLSNFFSESIWQKIGAESDAWWTIDSKEGIERASCCFYATARDMSRLGLLYLHNGKHKNQQIIPEWFVKESISPVNIKDKEGNLVKHYGYQWWLGMNNQDAFFQAQGIFGQYIIVVPNKNLVVVRTGKKRSDEKRNLLPADVYQYLDLAYKIAND